MRLFLALITFFSIWTILDVLLWASNRPDIVLFQWSLQILLEMLLYAAALYLSYTFVFKKDLAFGWKLLITALLLPIVGLMPTHYLLPAIDIAYCDATESSFVIFYTYGFEILMSFAILFLGFAGMHSQKERRKEISFFIAGIIVFLLAFSSGNIIGSVTEDWALAQAGLFGMPIFIAVLAYTSVRFKTFNLKLFGAQALVVVLWVLTLSQLFIRTLQNIRIIVGVNLLLFMIIGFFLIRSVRREIEQREHIEQLAKDLQVANENQVTLIHFITHQIKGFVTKSRNIFSMALEGDFGPLPEQMKPMIEEGLRSDTQGVNTIQEILNASNIKTGKVTYDMKPFDLKALIDETAGTLKPNADAKGLALNLNTGNEPLTITGDRGQLVNAFKNLIDNSIKYTQQGHVDVSLKKENGKAVFKVEDSGVGITPDDMKNLFTEGGHGKESTKVNVESTGFGLYIVKNIIEAHKGKVWAESEGAGKGSHFIVELPA